MSSPERKVPDKVPFHDISVKYEDRVVRIRSDESLFRLLHSDRKAGRQLAEQILKEYEARFKKPLQISLGSLNAEIRIHVFADRRFVAAEKFFTKIRIAPHLARLSHWLHVHTKVIDCGEKAIDTNRFVFDFFAPFYGGRKLIAAEKAAETAEIPDGLPTAQTPEQEADQAAEKLADQAAGRLADQKDNQAADQEA